jgi:hypothetical protein
VTVSNDIGNIPPEIFATPKFDRSTDILAMDTVSPADKRLMRVTSADALFTLVALTEPPIMYTWQPCIIACVYFKRHVGSMCVCVSINKCVFVSNL